MPARSLSQEDPWEEEMAIHSSILAWEIPWTEESGRLQSMGSQSQARLSTHYSLYFLNTFYHLNHIINMASLQFLRAKCLGLFIMLWWPLLLTLIKNYILCFIWLLEQPCPWMSLFLFSNNDTKATQIEKQSGQDLNPVLLYSKVQANVLQDALMQIVVLMPQGQRISIWRSHLILACKKLYVCMLSCSFMSDSLRPRGP